MSCPAFLTALRDQAAGAAATPALAAHLRVCLACREALEAERRILAEVDATIGGVGSTDPSRDLLARARALAATSPSRSWFAPGTWAAAAVLVLVLSAFVLQRLPHVPAEIPVPPTPAATPEATLEPPRDATRPPERPRRAVPAIPVAVPLVPPGQEAALIRFAELMASGVVAAMPPRLVGPEVPKAPIPEPPDLDRPLLTIEPIEAEEAPSEE